MLDKPLIIEGRSTFRIMFANQSAAAQALARKFDEIRDGCNLLEIALRQLGLHGVDEQGTDDIIMLDCLTGKSGEHLDAVLETLAPFVEPDSKLVVLDMWCALTRYDFDGRTLERVEGHMIFGTIHTFESLREIM